MVAYKEETLPVRSGRTGNYKERHQATLREIEAAQKKKRVRPEDLIPGGMCNEVLTLKVPQKVIRAHEKAPCLVCLEPRDVDKVQWSLPVDAHCAYLVGYVRCRVCKTAIATQVLISHAGYEDGLPFPAPAEGCTLPQPPRRRHPSPPPDAQAA